MSVTSLKSVSLGLMTMAGHIPVKKALELSRIEEDYQASLFGRVPGAHDLEEAQLSQNVFTSKLLFDLS
jgi:chaperone required for assembly of F1-ATPase